MTKKTPTAVIFTSDHLITRKMCVGSCGKMPVVKAAQGSPIVDLSHWEIYHTFCDL